MIQQCLKPVYLEANVLLVLMVRVFFLGDGGYGCTPYLLTPYNARQSPSDNMIFKNIIHNRKGLSEPTKRQDAPLNVHSASSSVNSTVCIPNCGYSPDHLAGFIF